VIEPILKRRTFHMDALADALVLAVTHISCRGEEGDEYWLDEDVPALEAIAYCLRRCTPAEERLGGRRRARRRGREGPPAAEPEIPPRPRALDGGDVRGGLESNRRVSSG
jgi:hypothetical protein